MEKILNDLLKKKFKTKPKKKSKPTFCDGGKGDKYNG